MNNWRRVDSIITYYGKGVTPKYVENSSIIVLNQKCIRNNKIDYSLAQFIDDTKNYNEDKFLKIGDVLINSTGQGTAGRVSIVENIPEGFRVITDSHILVLRTNNFYESKCLNYSLFSIESLLQTFMDGSTGQGEFDKVRLFNVNVGYSDDNKTQQKIAAVLSALDDKIEVNNKINAELEAMAKTLYDYWFVQFEFPNADGKPYKSSGGKMVYNPTLKREIPKDWEVKSLDGLFGISTDNLNPQKTPDKLFKHYSIPTWDSMKNYGIEEGSTINSNKFTVKKGDVLVSKLNPWFNRVIYNTDEEDIICSTEFVVLESKNEFLKSFLYLLLTNKNFIAYTVLNATGTSNSHKRINPQTLVKFLLPFNAEIIDTFGKLIFPLLEKRQSNLKQNQELAQLRDWLLPMLMNGQVTVE